MRRDQLEHAIRAACAILDRDEVIIVGSQSILGTWDECEMPARATLTNEADVMATDTDNARVKVLADELDGVAGEFSQFHETHGFYIDGVDQDTVIFPDGWRDRLVPVRNSNTDYKTGWCLDPHDLCASKLAAFREKDIEFVDALIRCGKIDTNRVLDRLDCIPAKYTDKCARARAWLNGRR